MPSDGAGPSAPVPRALPGGDPGRADEGHPRGRAAWLRSQGLGVACGLATVVLLAVGSVVIPATRGGASRDLAFDEIGPFFAAPHLAHLWFYLLVPVLGLYALSTLLATWHAVGRTWRTGQRAPAAYAAAVVHLGFLVALAAHLVGGLFSHDIGRVVVGPAPTPLPDGRTARTVALAVDRLPSGMPRTVRAELELVPPGGGAPERAVVGYNQPLSRGLGADLYLLEEVGQIPGAARFTSGDLECTAPLGGACRLGRVRVWLVDLERPRPDMPLVLAQVAAAPASAGTAPGGGRPRGAAVEPLRLWPGSATRLGDGTPLRLAAIEPRPAVALRGRHAAGTPFALVAAILFALGLALMGRRLVAGRGERGAGVD
jgi:hypothetical protein